MEDLLNIMLKRRSCRSYLQKDIKDDELRYILTAGLLAPTSRNRKPCEFILVKDKNTLNKLSKAKTSGSAMLSECNAAIVVVADKNKADTWVEDSSIALSYMNLAAEAQNIGSCWVQIHLRNSEEKTSEEYIRELFSLTENYGIVGILSLGYRNEEKAPHSVTEVEWGKVRVV